MEVVKRICDQVAVIDKGRLIEQGTVSEIFSNPKTELAQEFISSTFHITLPEEYLENLSDTPKHAKSYPIIKFELLVALSMHHYFSSIEKIWCGTQYLNITN